LKKKIAIGILLTLLLTSIATLAFNIQLAKAESGIVIDGKMDDWVALGLTPCGTDVEGNIQVYNPIATDLLEAWCYYSSGNLYLAIKVSLYYGFEYYEGWVRYYVLFDLSYRNESDDLGYGMGEYLLGWFSVANIGLFEFWEGDYVRVASLGWDEHAEYHNTTDYTGYIELKIPLSYFWKGEEITKLKIRFVTYDVEHKEEVNTLGDYEINVLSTDSQVSILSHSGWLDSLGYYHVSGEVENVGDAPASFVKVTATFYDSAGIVVATSFTYTTLSVLLPGRKSPFEVLLVDTTQAAKVHHYSLSVTFSATSPIPMGLEILSHSSYVDAVGYMHVVGEVENIATGTATYVKIAATFYNATGHVVATAFTYSDPSDLSPGQTAPFEVLLVYTNRVPLVDAYELTAESAQYALIPEFPSALILSLFMLFAMFALVLRKKTSKKTKT
jgi:hypothetical protein